MALNFMANVAHKIVNSNSNALTPSAAVALSQLLYRIAHLLWEFVYNNASTFSWNDLYGHSFDVRRCLRCNCFFVFFFVGKSFVHS